MSVSLVPVAGNGWKLDIGACCHPMNSAGQPFNPPPTRRRSDRVIRVTKNFAVFDPAGVYDCYIDTVNEFAITLAYPNVWEAGKLYAAGSYCQDSSGNVFFTSAGGTSAGDDSDLAGGSDTGVVWVASTSNCWPGQKLIRAGWGYMRSITGSPQTLEYDTGAGVAVIRYYETTFEIVERRSGWISDYADRGTMRTVYDGADDQRGGTYSAADLPAGAARREPILGPDGEPIKEPVMLDGAGQPETQVNKLQFMRFREYDKTDWSSSDLGLL